MLTLEGRPLRTRGLSTRTPRRQGVVRRTGGGTRWTQEAGLGEVSAAASLWPVEVQPLGSDSESGQGSDPGRSSVSWAVNSLVIQVRGT